MMDMLLYGISCVAAGAIVQSFIFDYRRRQKAREGLKAVQAQIERLEAAEEKCDQRMAEIDASLADCARLQEQMNGAINAYMELRNVTGILSHVWPGKTDIVLYSRKSHSFEGVTLDDPRLVWFLQDLQAEEAALAANAEHVRGGNKVQS